MSFHFTPYLSLVCVNMPEEKVSKRKQTQRQNVQSNRNLPDRTHSDKCRRTCWAQETRHRREVRRRVRG